VQNAAIQTCVFNYQYIILGTRNLTSKIKSRGEDISSGTQVQVSGYCTSGISRQRSKDTNSCSLKQPQHAVLKRIGEARKNIKGDETRNFIINCNCISKSKTILT
jgi:hypothetical protein